jgi:hypothetical protein
MLFSHTVDQHERSSTPLGPVPHENLFHEPKWATVVAPASAPAASRP